MLRIHHIRIILLIAMLAMALTTPQAMHPAEAAPHSAALENVPQTIILVVPELVSPPDGEATNNTAPTFTWNAPDVDDQPGYTIAGYNIQIGTEVYTVTAPTTAYTPTSPLNDGIYTWTVRSYDIEGDPTPYAPSRTLIIDTQLPTTPTLVSPANNTITNDPAPTFTWNAASDNGLAGVAGYNLLVGATMHPITGTTTTFTPDLLADAVYTWTVRAYDAAGNYGAYAPARTLTVDTQDPNTPDLISPEDDTLTNNTRPTFSWEAASDNGPAGVVGYNIQIGTTVYTVIAPTTAYIPPSSLANGSHTWAVRAYDAAGNYGEYSAARTLTVDALPPNTPDLISPEDNTITNNSRPTFSWNAASDNGLAGVAGYNIQIGTAVYTVISPTTAYTPTSALANGSHTWAVRAYDAAGNYGGYSAERTLIIDALPPNTPVLVSPANNTMTNNPSPTFTWGATSDNGLAGIAGYNLLIGATVYTITGTTTAFTPDPLDDAIYTWTVRAYDAAGNYGVYAAARTLTVDTQDPDPPTLINPEEDAVTNETRPTFTWDAAIDNGPAGVAGYHIRINTAVFTVVAPTTSYTPDLPLANDSYTWTVRAYDAAGNIGAYAPERSVLVNTLAPNVPTPISPANNTLTNDPTPTFTWDAPVDNGLAEVVGYNLRIGTAMFTITAPTTAFTLISPLEDNSYTWAVRAYDAAGNYGGYSTARTLIIDTQPPEAPALVSPAENALTNNPRPTFTWEAASDIGPAGVAGYNLLIGATVYTITAPTTAYTLTSSLANGSHTWAVRAYDAAGNDGAYAIARTLLVDTQPPTTPALVSPADNTITNNPSLTFTWEPASDTGLAGVAGYNLLIGATVYTITGTTTAFTPDLLADAIYTWTVRAYDAAGNDGAYATARTLIVDTQSPDPPTLLIPQEDDITNNTRPTFTWDAAIDNGPAGVVGYHIRINAAVFTVVAPTTSYTPDLPLANGSYTWTVRAYDAAGNIGAYAPERSVLVNTLAPNVPTPISPAHNTLTNDPIPTFTWDAPVDNGLAEVVGYNLRIGTTVYTITAPTIAFTPASPLEDNSYTWAVRAYDTAGNYGGYSTARTLIIDTQPPDAPAPVSPEENTLTNNPRPTFTWEAASDIGPAGVAGYNLLIGATVYTITAPTTTYTLTSSLANGSHTWAVRAYDAAGNDGAYATARTLLVDTQPPTTPALVSPADNTITNNPSLTFTWEPASDTGLAGVAGYNLLIGATVYTITGTATTFTPDLLADAIYTWTVRAYDAAGNDGAVAAARTLIVDTQPPNTPTLVSPEEGAVTDNPTPTFTWDAAGDIGPAGVAGYNLLIGTTMYTITAPTTTYTPISSLADGVYTWTVRAYDAAGNIGPYADLYELTISTRFSIYLPLAVRHWPPIPTTPTLNAINNPDGQGSYTVDWTSAERATTYILEESGDNRFSDPVEVYSGTSTSITLSDRGPTRYYYRVKARNDYGDSGWSNVRSVDVLWEREPNDSAAQANGPLISGLTYYGRFPSGADVQDYYFIHLQQAMRVELWLSNIAPGHDYDLVLRNANLQLVGYSGNPGNANEHIRTGILPAGQYYIQVYNGSGTGSTQAYRLRVVYPAVALTANEDAISTPMSPPYNPRPTP